MDAQKFSAHLNSSEYHQKSFAELIGYSDRQIRNWMTKNTDVHISILYAISETFNVSISDLLSLFP